VVQVGAVVTEAVGAVGAPGGALTINVVAVEVQPVVVFWAVTVYVFGDRPEKVPLT
jgi:hypothetical protein